MTTMNSPESLRFFDDDDVEGGRILFLFFSVSFFCSANPVRMYGLKVRSGTRYVVRFYTETSIVSGVWQQIIILLL